MQENGELMELNEHPTDAEIMSAIRYLDPDSCAERAEGDPSTVAGIETILLTITNALSCICLYMRNL